MNSFRVDYRQALVISGLTIVALLTRLYGLSESALVGDEIPTVVYAAERSASLVNPAYYTLVLASFGLFGVTEWSARLPSMLLGTAAIPIFYMTWRQVVGRNIAIIGAFFAILSSWLLWQSQFSRFYSGVFLFGSLSFFLYYRALTLDSLPHLVWALVANTLAVLFHLTSIMVVASCGAFSLLILVWPQSHGEEYSKRIAAIYLGICTLIGLIALPFLWGIAETRATRGDVEWGDKPGEMLLQIVRRTELPIALSAFFGFILLLQKDLSKGIYFGIGTVIPVVFLLAMSGLMNTHANYVIYSLPLILVLAAFFCNQAGLGLSNYRFGYFALPTIVGVLMLPPFLSHYTGKQSLDVRQAVEFVRTNFQNGDRVLTSVGEFEYYSRKSFDFSPNITRVSFRAGNWRELLEPHIDGEGRVWIILRTYRDPLPNAFEEWLLSNGSLRWRQQEKRIDYTVHGYQVFLVDSESINGQDVN